MKLLTLQRKKNEIKGSKKDKALQSLRKIAVPSLNSQIALMANATILSYRTPNISLSQWRDIRQIH